MDTRNKKILKRMINLCYLFAILNLVLAFSKGFLNVNVDYYLRFMYITGFFIGYIGIHLSVILKYEGGMNDVQLTTREKFMKIFGLSVILLFLGFLVWLCWRTGIFDILLNKY